jgi:radial spoke head protein 4A
VDDANLYEWAGVSFGKEETYRLFLSIKKFAETLPAEHAPLRFFGRVNTRTTPYYVLEGSTFEDPGRKAGRQAGRQVNRKKQRSLGV